MKETLKYLFDYKTLSKEASKTVLSNIALGKYSDPEIAAFISVYLMRPVTVGELEGFRDALLELCKPVDLSDFNTIDLCGTGGDEKNTFNISTLTSFVVAGAGGKVAKHGNYSVSSSCGSSNVLEFYGYQFTDNVDKLKSQIDKAGICFMHAPMFNPAMKNVAPVRKAMRMKTFFNMLGPMVNPSFPKNQMVGVYSLDVARLYNYIYQNGDKNFCIIHSLAGYDEISLTSPFKLFTRQQEQIITPESMGMKTIQPQDIYGGDSIEEVSGIFIKILEGKGTEAQNNVVIANAAYGLQCLTPNQPFDICLEQARQSLKDGKALKAFKTMIELSK